MNWNKKKYFFFAETISLILGGIIRVLHVLVYSVPVRDSYEYIEQIILWQKTGQLSIENKTPVLGLLLLRLPNDLWGIDILSGGICMNILLGLLIMLILMTIATKIADSFLITLATGLISATYPTLVHYSCQMIRENSYLFFFSLAALSMVNYAKKAKMFPVIMCGLFTACAILCRYEAIEIPLFCLTCFFAIQTKKRYAHRFLDYSIYLFSCTIFFLSFSLILGRPVNYYKDYFIKAQKSLQIETDV